MANLAKQLYELQAVDLELAEARGRIRTIEAQLTESEALTAARSEVARIEAQMVELQKSQREEETTVADLDARIIPLETKLYSGSIRIPKELASLQAEIDQFKVSKRIHEDRGLEAMEKLEAVGAEFKTAHEKLVATEQSWKNEQAALLEEKQALTAKLVGLEEQVKALRQDIPREGLDVYDSLVAPKQGKVVARVERGTCQGCRINLPMSDIQRARLGKDLIRCSNCGRILLVG